MNTALNLSKTTLASAAAALLLAGCSTASDSAKMAKEPAAKMAEVKCSGINSCKGTSACATATSACAGQNSCKGQGWLPLTEDECEAKGGEVLG